MSVAEMAPTYETQMFSVHGTENRALPASIRLYRKSTRCCVLSWFDLKIKVGVLRSFLSEESGHQAGGNCATTFTDVEALTLLQS